MAIGRAVCRRSSSMAMCRECRRSRVADVLRRGSWSSRATCTWVRAGVQAASGCRSRISAGRRISRAFLRAIDEAGKGATDLVLNGDTFELWQSTTDDCRHRDARLGCTEQEALARLNAWSPRMPQISSALGTFARNGANRLILVPGDHDAALLLPSVAARRSHRSTLRDVWRSPLAAIGSPPMVRCTPNTAIRCQATRMRSPRGRSRSSVVTGTVHLERPPGERLAQTLVQRAGIAISDRRQLRAGRRRIEVRRRCGSDAAVPPRMRSSRS